jgi:glutathione S-transferase
MSELELIIGNKNYSSWSLRPWLALKVAAIPFREQLIPLYLEDSKRKLLAISPAGHVPVLRSGRLLVWESLAICETAAEMFPEKELWPSSAEARGHARAISNEMHAGFAALRSEMTMNVRLRKRLQPSDETRADIARVAAIWEDCRKRYGSEGEFLFGRFSIADAMYAPVVSRFESYGVDLTGTSADYAATIRALPEYQAWCAAGREEPWTVPGAEA